MARFGTTSRTAATYVLLAGFQRGISLLVLPFITHAMSPVEYGAASMLSAASLVLAAVIATPLVPLIVRAAARGGEDGPALLRAAGTYCYLWLPFIIGAGAAGFALFVPQFLGVSGSIWGIELLAIGLQPATSTFAMWVARAREDLRRFVWLSATSVLATAGAKLMLVVEMRLGVLGWALSDLISAGASALLAMTLIRRPHARPDAGQIKYALKFTVPLIPHAASLWALTNLSRPALAAVSSFEQVGLLSFGLNLALIASLVLSECNAALLPHYARENFPAPGRETLGPVRWQLVGAFAIPAAVGCGVAVAGRWIFAEPYWPSFALTGVLLAGQAAYGLYLVPMNYLTQSAGLPKFSALASGAGAAVILISILTFGHRYGAVGVAYITVAGYLTMAVAAVALTKTHKLNIAWRSWLSSWPELALAAGALICSMVALESQGGSTPGWLFTATCAALILSAVIVTSRRRQM